jgi:hypothetical protein
MGKYIIIYQIGLSNEPPPGRPNKGEIIDMFYTAPKE